MAALLVVMLLVPAARVLAAVSAPSAAATPAAASAALAVLPRFLIDEDLTTTLLVYGRARWTDALLRGLPPGVPRALLPAADLRERRWNNAETLALVVADDPDDPDGMVREYPVARRTIFWFALRADGAPPVIQAPSSAVVTRALIVVLSFPNGTSAAYGVPTDASMTLRSRDLRVLDRWTPATRSWARAKGFDKYFRPFCPRWRQPPPSEPLTIWDIRGADGSSSLSELPRLAQRLSGRLPWRVGIIPMTWATVEFVRIVDRGVKACRVDAVISEDGIDLGLGGYVFDEGMHPVVAVVPAGLGPEVSPLKSVTLEFSPAVWLCTALAALGTAAALACTLRRDRGAALLLALAPLLAQPPPAAVPALRPLLGAWLLVCVVLAAAYQGLLLGMLSSARPRGEIDSLEALADSGLPVFAPFSVMPLFESEVNFTVKPMLFHEILQRLEGLAVSRDFALVVPADRGVQRLVGQLTFPEKLVHTFPLGFRTVKAVASWMRGSPLARAVTTAFWRLSAAGLRQRWNDVLDEICRKARARHLLRRERHAPLTLHVTYPAFLVLAFGLLLACLAFSAEMLAARCLPRGKIPFQN
ncbi:putative glutamate receptor [Frankliniella fusca]|uniref:Glutamate receptor n=1 Tax=Frankliniella fusca TaxID=407009 RepID=A0AAE1H3T4_9NEOP|nr:putative glutamate receptor [Frankliniella fusca]